MPGCPACGSEVAPGASECPRCHLAVHLFEAVREAVGVPESDPTYGAEVRELLKAVDPEGGPDAPKGSTSPGRIAYPARFPAPSPPSSAYPEGPGPRSLESLPALPALPGGGVAGLRRQLDAYLHLARRLGLDLTPLDERVKEAVGVDDARALEALLRELFVRLAAVLSEAYEEVVGLRGGLSAVVAVPAVDGELEEARASLARGDLEGVDRQLRAARQSLSALEEEWETVQILVTECDLLAATVRELGGDPGPALGPLDEGRRLARAGKRAEAEPVLAHAALALWAILNPLFGREMRRVKEALLARRASGADVAPAIGQLRVLAQELSRRNFGAAVLSYRWLRDFVEGPAPEGAARDEAPAPAPAGVPSTSK